jgi:hypothetical protein
MRFAFAYIQAVAMTDGEYEYPEPDDDCDEQEDIMEVDEWMDGAPKNALIQFDCQEINKFDGLRAFGQDTVALL